MCENAWIFASAKSTSRPFIQTFLTSSYDICASEFGRVPRSGIRTRVLTQPEGVSMRAARQRRPRESLSNENESGDGGGLGPKFSRCERGCDPARRDRRRVLRVAPAALRADEEGRRLERKCRRKRLAARIEKQ